MDSTAFFKLTYGLYVVSTTLNGKDAGCIVNTLYQVTAEPAKLSVTINKDNATEQMIEKSGRFAAVALTTSADMDLIGRFGFHSSRDTDKFEGYSVHRDANDMPTITEHVAARYSCRVVNQLDLGSHVLFVGEVCEAENISELEVMTYSYYHQVKKGLTPKGAPSYQSEQAQEKSSETGFRCIVCGYHLESDTIPDDFVCPICGMGKDQFKKL